MFQRRGKDLLSVFLIVLGVLLAVVSPSIVRTVLEVTPEWILRSVCDPGNVCAIPLVLYPFLVAMVVLWSIARLYDEGYLTIPEEW